MPKPTPDEIRTAVIETIARHARKPKASIKDDQELTGIAIGLKDIDLGFLAMSLRGYVKTFNKQKTITKAQVKKAKTVAGTVTLVQKAI